MWPPPLLRTAVRIFSGYFAEALEQLVDRKRRKVGVSLQRLVQIGDVGVVVFAVMNFHGHLVDVRLQRIGRVRERWKNVGQRTLLL